MKNKFYLFLIVIFTSSCKINQLKNKLKTGVWIENYTLDSIDFYTSKGKYRKGEPVKTWKKYKNNKLVKKEKYVGNVCFTTNFHEDGKIESIGKVKMIANKTETHWFYFDDWYYYDLNGKLIRKAKYENGILVSEQVFSH